ncbi:MAG: aminotransferase class I/II-fold pyridoxal phosphate-dependent enzyme [Clostridia bacterium]|nr:aminotransferase class I/II-fold pyridoxal phosphate-dependent enzyme [Clostridia bacterium]
MSRFFSAEYSSLAPYVPGEQPRDKKYVKLNTNESPFPPSPKVIEAVSEETDFRLYPDPECRELKNALGAALDVEPETVFVSNGSDSILSHAFAAFGGEGIAFADVTYGFDSVIAAYHGLKTRVIETEDDLSIDPEKFMGLGCAAVITEPNAPTGLCVGVAAIEEIAKSSPDRVLIVDEAYVDFGAESSLRLAGRLDNVLVVRTFSKSRQLAGARVGFAVGSKELIRDLETLKFSTDPYCLTRQSLAAAKAAIEDKDYFERTRRAIMDERERTRVQLLEAGFDCAPSMTNFLFAKHPGIPGGELYLGLKDRGVLVRHFTQPKISDYIRVTVGSRGDMDRFLTEVGALAAAR